MNVLFLIKIYYKMLNKLRIHRLKLTFLKWIIGTHRKLTHSRGVQKMIGLLLLHHILEIENSLYLCNRSSDTTKFCMSMQIGPRTMRKVKISIFAQFKMADGRHIENLKFAISPEPFLHIVRRPCSYFVRAYQLSSVHLFTGWSMIYMRIGLFSFLFLICWC